MELNTYDLILTSTKHPALRQEAVIDCSIDTFCNPKDIAEVFRDLKELN